MSEAHAAELDKFLTPYLEHAQRVGGRHRSHRPGRPPRSTLKPAPPSRCWWGRSLKTRSGFEADLTNARLSLPGLARSARLAAILAGTWLDGGEPSQGEEPDPAAAGLSPK